MMDEEIILQSLPGLVGVKSVIGDCTMVIDSYELLVTRSGIMLFVSDFKPYKSNFEESWYSDTRRFADTFELEGDRFAITLPIWDLKYIAKHKAFLEIVND
jgi:hypothetical protein